jgi:hypothetical protein
MGRAEALAPVERGAKAAGGHLDFFRSRALDGDRELPVMGVLDVGGVESLPLGTGGIEAPEQERLERAPETQERILLPMGDFAPAAAAHAVLPVAANHATVEAKGVGEMRRVLGSAHPVAAVEVSLRIEAQNHEPVEHRTPKLHPFAGQEAARAVRAL